MTTATAIPAARPTHYIVQTASAAMPNSCWGVYRRVAVLEVEAGVERVSMISDRARGVVRVVQTWEKLNVGLTPRCAYARALAAATELVAELAEDARRAHHAEVMAYHLAA